MKSSPASALLLDMTTATISPQEINVTQLGVSDN
jgi:hypothetical protein